MSKIRKKEPKPHLVVADSSVLWCKDKSYVVDPTFNSFWDKYSKDFKLELVIPEVVRGELLFQQSTSAIKSMKNAAKEVEEISSITDKKLTLKITELDIKGRVEKRFDKWLKCKGGRLAKTPINKINWGVLIHNAIWREPPFEFDPSNKDKEKGFRDTLILETVIDICNLEHRQIGIVFLCNDNLLRETAQKKLSSDQRFISYESIEGFESYLKFTKEKLKDQFIRSLIRKANEKFYSKDDPNCLYLRENMRTRLRDDYKEYFDNPKKSDRSYIEFSGLWSSSETWEPQDKGIFWISNAQFVKIESGNEYYWISKVTFVRQYRKQYGGGSWLTSIGLGDTDVERVLVLPFYITWKAKITKDARFRSLTVVSDELKGNSFQKPTEEQRKLWNLRSAER